jgi:hypothetical protein
MPSVTHARTIAVLLDTIAAGLNADGATVEPNDIDSSGMSIVIDGLVFRLEIAEPELMDDADWRRRFDDYEHVATSDQSSAFIGEADDDLDAAIVSRRLASADWAAHRPSVNAPHIDPAGFNGMESSDVEF